MSVNFCQRIGLHDEYNRPTELDAKLAKFSLDTVLPIVVYICLCYNFVLENRENWHLNLIKSVKSQVLAVQDIAKNGVNAVPTNFIGCSDEQTVTLTADFTKFYLDLGSYMEAFDICSTYLKIDDSALGTVHVLDVPSLAAERHLDRVSCFAEDNGTTIAHHDKRTRFIAFFPVYFESDACSRQGTIAHEFTHGLGFSGLPDHSYESDHNEGRPGDDFGFDMPYCVEEFVSNNCGD